MNSLKKSKKDRLKLRNKVITRGRTKLNHMIKKESYLDWLKEEHGVMGMNELLLDKVFLDDCIKEIEKNRERRLVYDLSYKRHWLDEWLKKRDRKLFVRRINEKNKEKEKNT